jgi:hypothetical protein
MTEPRYNSPRYLLDKAKKEIESAVASMDAAVVGLEETQGSICRVKPLVPVFGSGEFSDASSNPSRFTNSFFYHSGRFSSGCFEPNQESKEYAERVYTNFVDYADRFLANIKKIHEGNLSVLEGNKKAFDTISKFLKSYGLSEFEYDTSEKRGKRTEVKRDAGWLQSLKRQIELSDGYDQLVRNVEEQKKAKLGWRDSQVRKAVEAEAKANEELLKTREFAEALIYARANGLEEANETLIATVEEHKLDKWRQENYPDGTEMTIKCCDFCSSWVVGERRCACGNRRMSLAIEKNGDSFYAYAEPY